jgi:type I restriction enzyme S subunit
MENNKPQIRIKGFDEHLEPAQLGKICVIGDIDHRMPPTVSEGIPYLMTGDFIGLNDLDFENAKLVSIEDYNQLSKKIKPELGDILFARYASIGDVRYVETNKKFLISYSCAIIKKSDSICEKYLYYYLQNNKIQNQIELEINTGSQRNIGIDSIRKLTFQLPKETEQKKISAFFENLDKLLIEHQQKQSKLKALKKAMLSKMFPQQGQTVPEIRFKGFVGEWEEKKLEEIGKATSGTSIESEFDKNGQYKVISIGSYSENSTYTDQGLRVNNSEKTHSKLLNFNDLTMVLNDKTASGNILGRVLHIKEDKNFVYNQRTQRIEPYLENFDPLFLYHLFNAPEIRNKILKISQGNTQIYVNWSAVRELKYMIPIKDEQIMIGNYFKNLDSLISNHEIQIEKLQNIKKAFLAKMFI